MQSDPPLDFPVDRCEGPEAKSRANRGVLAWSLPNSRARFENPDLPTQRLPQRVLEVRL